MVSKSIRHIVLCLFAVTLITGFISTPLSDPRHETSNYKDLMNDNDSRLININLDFNILQNDTTTVTTNETTTETRETTTTTTEKFTSWKSFIGADLYYPLAVIFSILGIFSTIWLIFFVETSRERTIQERIIGTVIRLIIMAICVGFAIHFWVLFEPM